MSAASCERCGAERSVAYCHRLSRQVCWRCYHRTLSDEAAEAAKRIALQRRLADAIRRVIEPLRGARRDRLAARALLIETAASPAEVESLVAEVRRLGVAVEVEAR